MTRYITLLGKNTKKKGRRRGICLLTVAEARRDGTLNTRLDIEKFRNPEKKTFAVGQESRRPPGAVNGLLLFRVKLISLGERDPETVLYS